MNLIGRSIRLIRDVPIVAGRVFPAGKVLVVTGQSQGRHGLLISAKAPGETGFTGGISGLSAERYELIEDQNQ